MIEVGDLAEVERKVFEITVVRILLNENYFPGANGLENAIGNSCLTRTSAAADANYHLKES